MAKKFADLTKAQIEEALKSVRADTTGDNPASENSSPAGTETLPMFSAAGSPQYITAADFKSYASGATLPVVDTTSIVKDPVDATKTMRIDVGAVSTATVRVLTMPDQDVDLTPGNTFQATLANPVVRTGGAPVDNQIPTFTGTGEAIQAESNFTYDGTTLNVSGGTLAIGGVPDPGMYFAPSSGATKQAQLHQSGDVLHIADLGVANRISIDIATGNITAGTWAATAVAPAYGGTGQDFNASSGVLSFASGTASVSTTVALAQINDTNGNEEVVFTPTASAVNYLTVANAATGGAVAVGTGGTDIDVGLDLNTKGAGIFRFNNAASSVFEINTRGNSNDQLIKVRTADHNSWAFVFGNETYSTDPDDGFKMMMTNAGVAQLINRGNDAYTPFEFDVEALGQVDRKTVAQFHYDGSKALIKTDHIDELTAAAGVTIESVLIKDGWIQSSTIITSMTAETTPASGDFFMMYDATASALRKVDYDNMPGVGSSALPVVDSTAVVKGSVDATKLLRLEVDGITTGTTRVWTAPDKDIDFAQAVLYNTKGSFTKQQRPAYQTLTYAAPTTTWNTDNAVSAQLTLTGNLTTLDITNPVQGTTYLIEVVQDATGGRTITNWGSTVTVVWQNATAPTLSTASGAKDIIIFYYDGTALIGSYGYTIGTDVAAASHTHTEANITDLGTTVAMVADNLSVFASTTSAQLAGVISDETGSGSLVFASSPTLVTPVLGVATATSINKVALTAPATSATLTIADGKTLTANNSITFAGTDSTTMTFPGVSGTVPILALGQEWTRTQNFNATTLTDGATINWDLDQNQACSVTLAGNRTMAAPTNMKDGATYALMVKQDATGSRTITWNAVFKWPGGTAPTLSTAANAIDMLFFYCDGTNLYGASTLNYS